MTRRRGLALWVMATISVWPPAGVLAQAPASSAAPVLTLDAAIDAALSRNRQVQSGALDVSKADESTAAIKATRFPKITANLLAGVSLTPITFTIPGGTLGTYPGLGPLPAADSPITTPRQLVGFFQASVAQPLSQLFKINLALEESDVDRQLANEQLRAARQDTVLQVKHAYADLSQLQNQIESAEAALASLTELSALTGRRLAEQAVLKADDLSVKAKLSQQRYQLLSLRDALDSGRESFNRLLGRDLGERFSVDRLPVPSREELGLEQAEAQALAHRSELQTARAHASKLDVEARRTKAEYIPDVSLQLSYLSFANVNFLPSTGIAQLGLSFQWEPFDWGSRQHRVAALTLTRQQADLAAADTEAAIRTDVRASYRRLGEARALIEAESLAEEAERERLRVTMNRYEQNAVLLADVLQAQAAVAAADAAYQQALAGFWQAKAAFERAIGEDK